MRVRHLLPSAAVALALVLTTRAVPARAAASGTFTALTYNVAGLPQGLSSAPGDRAVATTAIGGRLGPYDVINVQEDFNYHAYLYASDTHPYRTPTSGGAGFGSGLNTLSGLPYEGLQRVRWNACWIGSGDCLTPKGFTFKRIKLADGAYVDLYNLHADAGDGSGDLWARRANLRQLTDFIKARSAGHAVLVMGDTNTRYTRTGDEIARFAAGNGLTDTWVELERGGTAPPIGSPALVCDDAAPADDCEVVDKILYRGGGGVDLHATAYENDDAGFRTADGVKLSDHFPIAARFSWTATG